MRRCYRCGRSLCSNHARAFDKHIVCGRCRTLQFILHRILKPVFFKRVTRT
jgi:ribosomal protein S27AE